MLQARGAPDRSLRLCGGRRHDRAHDPAADDLPDRRPTVLLVDDDEVNLLLTSAALRSAASTSPTATGGEQAIRTLAELDARHRRPRRRHARASTASRPARAARTCPASNRAGADADRPRRRRLDHPRLRGRRHRLLRQGDPVEPARRAPALPAARLAHAARSSSAARPSWPARRTSRAWAASTGGRTGRSFVNGLDVLDRGPARVRLRAGRPRQPARHAAHDRPTTDRERASCGCTPDPGRRSRCSPPTCR